MTYTSLRWICPKCGASLHPAEEEACVSCGLRFNFTNGYWSAEGNNVQAHFSRERRDYLAALEPHHFWFPARYRLTEKIFRRWLPARASAAIDLGCGTGKFLPALRAAVPAVVGVDAHQTSLSDAAAREPSATLIHSDAANTPLDRNQFDAVVALDVLEHADPIPLMKEMSRLARPGALLIVSVPAFQILWSRLDEAAGHRLRYRVEGLRQELMAGGWDYSGHTHYQFFLFPLVLLSRRLFSRSDTPLERKPPPLVGRFLGAVNNLEVSMLWRCALPFGSSLIAWARRR